MASEQKTNNTLITENETLKQEIHQLKAINNQLTIQINDKDDEINTLKFENIMLKNNKYWKRLNYLAKQSTYTKKQPKQIPPPRFNSNSNYTPLLNQSFYYYPQPVVFNSYNPQFFPQSPWVQQGDQQSTQGQLQQNIFSNPVTTTPVFNLNCANENLINNNLYITSAENNYNNFNNYSDSKFEDTSLANLNANAIPYQPPIAPLPPLSNTNEEKDLQPQNLSVAKTSNPYNSSNFFSRSIPQTYNPQDQNQLGSTTESINSNLTDFRLLFNPNNNEPESGDEMPNSIPIAK